LKDDKIQREKVIIYNFDDKKIRINSYGHVDSFLKLYEYVYGKKPLDIRWNSYGIPQNIGDIEIKIFQIYDKCNHNYGKSKIHILEIKDVHTYNVTYVCDFVLNTISKKNDLV